ncbi:hypothetical protein [Glaciimonas sp. PCH181]|nr:hypothetical protein [Glaciimonas sp. PCH181]
MFGPSYRQIPLLLNVDTFSVLNRRNSYVRMPTVPSLEQRLGAF